MEISSATKRVARTDGLTQRQEMQIMNRARLHLYKERNITLHRAFRSSSFCCHASAAVMETCAPSWHGVACKPPVAGYCVSMRMHWPARAIARSLKSW
jgi:hypothetical protein